MDTPEEFLARVMPEPNSGCWIWLGAWSGDGYGNLKWRGKYRSSHRVAWELLRGPIPAGLDIDHKCRNTVCCNPDHLEPVTTGENLRRGFLHWNNGQKAKTHCKRGHAFAGSNLRLTPRGHRVCRACMAAHQIAFKKRKKESR